MILEKSDFDSLCVYYIKFVYYKRKYEEKSGLKNKKFNEELDTKNNLDADYDIVEKILKDIDSITEYPELSRGKDEEAFLNLKEKVENEFEEKCSKKNREKTEQAKKSRNMQAQRLKTIKKLIEIFQKHVDLQINDEEEVSLEKLQSKYYGIWEMWSYVIATQVQNLVMYQKYDINIFNNVSDLLRRMLESTEHLPLEDREQDFEKRYYRYYKLMQIKVKFAAEIEERKKNYNELIINSSVILEEMEDKDKFGENERLSENNYDINELKKRYYSGIGDPCSDRTFKKKREMCQALIEVLNEQRKRKLDYDVLQVQCAVYRVLISKRLKFERNNGYTIAKKILQAKGEGVSKKIFQKLHSDISNAIIMQAKDWKEKCLMINKFLEEFYKLMLVLIYNDYPNFNCTNAELKKRVSSLNEKMVRISNEVFSLIESGVVFKD